MRYVLLTVWLLMTSSLAFAQDPDAILGKWQTPEEKSVVEIYRCGSKICGKIIDLKEKVYEAGDPMAGKEKVDRENPDKNLRGQLIIGLEIMKDFVFKSGNVWGSGTIYDPEKGKTYKCKATLEDEGTLNIRGYIGIPTLGRTSVWKRLEP